MGSHLHSCPHCEREFNDLRDFPRIYIKSLEQLPVPELIAGSDSESDKPIYIFNTPNCLWGIIPNRIVFSDLSVSRTFAKVLRDSDQKIHVYNGRIYSLITEGPHPFRREFRDARIYFSKPDVTEIFRTALSFPETQELLQQAKTFIGQEIKPDDFIKTVTEELSRSRIGSQSNNYRELVLGIRPINPDLLEKGLGEISLRGHYYDGKSLPLEFGHPVARFSFEGRIND